MKRHSGVFTTLASFLVSSAVLPAFAQPNDASAPQATTSKPASASMAAVFAPSGTLRASINLGNPVLAALDPATGKPVGVSVDLASEFAKRLGVPLQLVAVKSAGTSVENVEQDKADIGFFAVDPKRGQEIAFTKPYVLIEGFYLVRAASPITTNEQVDQSGVTVAVGKGSAYDLFLTRELHHATSCGFRLLLLLCRAFSISIWTWPPASSSSSKRTPPKQAECAYWTSASW